MYDVNYGLKRPPIPLIFSPILRSQFIMRRSCAVKTDMVTMPVMKLSLCRMQARPFVIS